MIRAMNYECTFLNSYIALRNIFSAFFIVGFRIKLNSEEHSSHLVLPAKVRLNECGGGSRSRNVSHN